MNLTEILIETLFTGFSFGGLFSGYKWWQNRRDRIKKEKIKEQKELISRKKALESQKKNTDAWKRSEKIYSLLYQMSLDYTASYIHVMIFHDGGKDIRPEGEKKISIRYEIKKEYYLKDKMRTYNKFELDHGFIKVAAHLSTHDDFYVISDVGQLHSSKFKRFFNKHEGKIVIMKKICYIGDSLVAICIQLDTLAKRDMLNPKDMDKLKHEVDMLEALFIASKEQFINEMNNHA